jgi:hypothetical protein
MIDKIQMFPKGFDIFYIFFGKLISLQSDFIKQFLKDYFVTLFQIHTHTYMLWDFEEVIGQLC